jgi:hypothetical protein
VPGTIAGWQSASPPLLLLPPARLGRGVSRERQRYQRRDGEELRSATHRAWVEVREVRTRRVAQGRESVGLMASGKKYLNTTNIP